MNVAVEEGLVRLADLREPVLTNEEREFLAGIPRVEMTVESVLAEATRLTGLTDFGPDDFRERLAFMLAEYDKQTTLSTFGRMRPWREAVRDAANRLCLIDLYKRHPEIDEVVIDRPIIVAGMPRSGTSHTVNVIAADRRLRSMPLWESLEPIPWPFEAATGQDLRRQRCQEGMWGTMARMQPYLSLMHDMGPDYVHEDSELMGGNFGNYYPEFKAYLRAWQDRLFTEDQTPHHAFAKQGLKAMTWLRGPNRWVTKAPSHLENLEVLTRVYPDASFVVLHRDPVAVLQSLMIMMAYNDRLRRTRVDVATIREFWTDRIERVLRAMVAQRDTVPAERSLDVLFHEYMADPMHTLRQIYAQADLPLTGEALADIEGYVASHPRGMHGKLVYDPIGDFDLDVKAVRERFGFYYDRFPVRQELVLGEKL
jgi:hypothetical protein